MNSDRCPVCGSIDGFERGDETVLDMSPVKIGPDGCYDCGYVESINPKFTFAQLRARRVTKIVGQMLSIDKCRSVCAPIECKNSRPTNEMGEPF